MRSLVISLVLLLTAFVSDAADLAQLDRATWRQVKVYQLRELESLDPPPVGKVVGVKFDYRHERIRQLKPNWYQGSLWQVDWGQGQARFRHVTVLVAADALSAFQALPAEVRSRKPSIAYGQVLLDADAGFPFLRLLGTKVRQEKAGSVRLSW